jgi:hypothetical protein
MIHFWYSYLQKKMQELEAKLREEEQERKRMQAKAAEVSCAASSCLLSFGGCHPTLICTLEQSSVWILSILISIILIVL